MPYVSLVRSDRGATDAEIKSLFDRAEERAPCILFIDELDALCPGSGFVLSSLALPVQKYKCRRLRSCVDTKCPG